VKRKILIASFLKPVNDIRSYEKIAKTLAVNPNYSIYCIGYPSNIELSDNKIQLLPLSYFNKSGFGRIKARWEAFNLYVKVKPEVIIVNSPDLLVVTILYKILFGAKICYDIRENYFKNFWHQKNYNWFLRHILALLVRGKEVITAPLFNHFFLAEKVYKQQLKLIGQRYSILENKSLKPAKTIQNQKTSTPIRFIISGTIAYEYGIIEGLNFFSEFSKNHPNSTLKIIGLCANKNLFNSLLKSARNNKNIEIKISSNPVPHAKIEEAILLSNVGLLPYQKNGSIEGKWPTKLFEYMSYKLPILIQENETWNSFIEKNNSGISIDFSNPKSYDFDTLLAQKFYTSPLPEETYWSSQERVLTTFISNFLKE